MKRTIIFLLMLAAVAAPAAAQFDNVGTSAATFLKIDVGSRGTAVGGAWVASANDVTAMYWNPAGLSRVGRLSVTFSHTDWISDVAHQFVGVGIPLGESDVLGFGLTYLSIGDMKVTTWEQTQGTGETFSAYDAAIGMTYSRSLSDRFRLGVQLKYVAESISRSSASAIAVDVGAQYETAIKGLRLGMMIANFGTPMKIEGEDLQVKVDPFPDAGSNPDRVPAYLATSQWSLPLYFQLGASFDVIRSEAIGLTASMDFRDERDYRSTIQFGAEATFFDVVSIRGGLQPQTDGAQKGSLVETEQTYVFTGGAGLNVNIPGTEWQAQFDYAYSDLQRLKSIHRLTLGISL